MMTVSKSGENEQHKLVMEGNWVLLDGIAIDAKIVEKKTVAILSFNDGDRITLVDTETATQAWNLDYRDYRTIKSMIGE